MLVVSACLLGIGCRYDGDSSPNPQLLEAFSRGEVIPVCPEQLGGMPTPRVPSEIRGGNGFDVIDGRCPVVDRDGNDRTGAFLRGAREVLRICQLCGLRRAVLKERSPSCGTFEIADGTFSGRTRAGMGVTAALLSREGIIVSSDEHYTGGDKSDV
jgi:uncharacterized protein YbbK (DUF523 family)